MKAFNKLLSGEPAGSLIIGALILFLSLAAELLVFNHHFFTSRAGDEGFAHEHFELPVHPQTGTSILVMDSKHNELTLNGINRALANIKLTALMDNDKIVSLKILARAHGDEYSNIGSVKVNPARKSQNSGTVHFNHADGALVFEDLKIIVTGPDNFIVAITGLEFNAPEQLHFSWVRLTLLFLVILGAALTVRFRLHVIIFDERLRAHRALNYGVVALALGICTFFFWASYPKNCNPYYFDFFGEAVYPYNDINKSLTRPLPDTIEENNAAGPYEQLLAAMLKGQLNINVFVDPHMENLRNPYDPSERNHSGVTFTWDRPYYQGKYFVYFGITPLLMVYAPFYALTGVLPAPAVAIYIMSMMAALSMLWAFRSLVRALAAQPNLMLYLLTQLAGLSSGFLWIIHAGISFYYLSYMAALLWISLYLAAIFNLLKPANPLLLTEGRSRKYTRAMLLLAGISIPMVVSSRPLALLLIITLTVPAIITIIRENYSIKGVKPATGISFWRTVEWPELSRDSLFAIVPVVTGAVLIMVYNYVRFDSVSEFGQTYQLTFDDVSSKGLHFGWAHLRNVLYYFFFEPIVWTREFPFVFADGSNFTDHGNLNFANDRLSVFAFPLLWAMWLALRSRKGLLALTLSHLQAAMDKSVPGKEVKSDSTMGSWISVLDARMGMLRNTTMLTGTAMILVSYGTYYNAAVASRYLCEIIVSGTFMAIVLTLLNFGCHPAAQDGQAQPAQASPAGADQAGSCAPGDGKGAFLAAGYALSLFFTVKTMLIGLLLPLSYNEKTLHMGTVLNQMNPSMILDLYRIFTPFGQ